MKKTYIIFLIWTFPFLSFGKTAKLKAYGLQISLEPAVTSLGSYVYFTSYDGSTGYPRMDGNYISNEMKPSYQGSSTYVADYMAGDYYNIYEYGSVSLNIPSSDSDGNGVHDWLQKENSVSLSITGSTSLHWNDPSWETTQYTITGNMYRTAGQTSGTYNFSLSYGSGAATISGVWNLSYYEGTMTYEDGSFSANLETIGSDGEVYAVNGSSSYSFPSENSLKLNQTTYTSNYGNIVMNAVTLSRNQDRFSGFLDLVDGGPVTSWSDYTDWYLEVIDENDEDEDNIPDIVDSTVKVATALGVNLNGWNYHAWPWVFSSTLNDWLYFAVYEGGGIIVWNNQTRTWYYWDTTSGTWLSQ